MIVAMAWPAFVIMVAGVSFFLAPPVTGVQQGQLLQWAVAFGVGALALEVFRSIRDRKRMGADYADVISKSSIALLQPLHERVAELQEEAALCRAEAKAARKHVKHLEEELELALAEVAVLRKQIGRARKDDRTERKARRKLLDEGEVRTVVAEAVDDKASDPETGDDERP